MCYNVQYLTKKAEEYAARLGRGIDEILPATQSKEPVYQVSGFVFPSLPILLPHMPIGWASWGLVPSWTRDLAQAMDMRGKTLNARLETIDQLPSFKNEVANGRCLVLLDGFFEHHHLAGKTYPYFIQASNQAPILVAGIYTLRQGLPGMDSPDTAIKTVSIVTTRANNLMKEIHNNPKLPHGPRMPLILDHFSESWWLNGQLEDLRRHSLEDGFLKAHTVLPLSGTHSPGNTPRASIPFLYPVIGLPQ
ncbi:MAG: SOS response-associated peptidase family protein [Bacteroidetes bacterium]|jgi:putative SOS response-associated peptidase YedK|nr:SOS response-associated peptidase family protein [Bacteroidota bacterium]